MAALRLSDSPTSLFSLTDEPSLYMPVRFSTPWALMAALRPFRPPQKPPLNFFRQEPDGGSVVRFRSVNYHCEGIDLQTGGASQLLCSLVHEVLAF